MYVNPNNKTIKKLSMKLSLNLKKNTSHTYIEKKN